jgi:RNA polymerase sigma-70 factor (ECF subfamily)
MNDDDATIVRLLESGHEQGVVLLLERHGGRVASYLRRRFPSLTDDQLHDALVDAVLALRESYDPSRSHLGSWLLLLAHQKAVNRLRRRRRPQASDELDRVVDHRQGPESRLEEQQQWEQLQEALAGLSSLERAVIEADLAGGQPANAEVLARQLKTTARSVYAARTRARQKLLQRHRRGELL